MKTILLMVIASVLWVQVPQWSDDWSKCAVDVPDAACHGMYLLLIILLVKVLVGKCSLV